MNAYKVAEKLAKDYLNTYTEAYKSRIDELIKPTCSLMTQNGFITLHSCSCHIKATQYRNSFVEPHKPHLETQWYISFVATKPINQIEQLIETLNKRYDYNMTLESSPYFQNGIEILTNRWLLEFILEDIKFDDYYLYELNKNVHDELQNIFNKKS